MNESKLSYWKHILDGEDDPAAYQNTENLKAFFINLNGFEKRIQKPSYYLLIYSVFWERILIFCYILNYGGGEN